MVFIGQQFFYRCPLEMVVVVGGWEVGFCERISAGNFNCMSGDKSKAKNIFPFIFFQLIFFLFHFGAQQSLKENSPHIYTFDCIIFVFFFFRKILLFCFSLSVL
jgi:hypothetical protein